MVHEEQRLLQFFLDLPSDHEIWGILSRGCLLPYLDRPPPEKADEIYIC